MLHSYAQHQIGKITQPQSLPGVQTQVFGKWFRSTTEWRALQACVCVCVCVRMCVCLVGYLVPPSSGKLSEPVCVCLVGDLVPPSSGELSKPVVWKENPEGR